jgi:hypothetical protein
LSEPRRWLSARWKGWAPAPREERLRWHARECTARGRPDTSKKYPNALLRRANAAAAAALPKRDSGAGGYPNELTVFSLARPRDATPNDSGPKRLAFALPDTLRGRERVWQSSCSQMRMAGEAKETFNSAE